MNDNNNDERTEQTEGNNELEPTKLIELSEGIQKSAQNAGWQNLTDVQSNTIPYILNSRDVMVQSQTGSGKTGAYLLPLLDKIKTQEKAVQAMVLVPTRELAIQVEENAKTLFKNTDITSVCVYGGVGYKKQKDAFTQGVHVVIGTPGRILDHLISNNLSLKQLTYFVLDEADRMLSMGFMPDMQKLKEFLPNKPRVSMMFSATYPMQVIRVSRMFLRNPDIISLSKDHIHVLATSHMYYRVPAMDKDRFLVKLIEMENPDSAIIFCNTKTKVNYICEVLKRFGYDAEQMNADLTQSQRERVIEKIKSKKLRFLVATDVAARGIDIQDLSHVIHYEIPEDHEAYIHRSGRTGRAGASGKIISIAGGIEAIEIKKIANKFSIALIECKEPDDKELEAMITQRSLAFLEAEIRSLDNIQRERLERFIPVIKDLAQDNELAPLLAMLIDQYYHSKMHDRGNTPLEEAPENKQSENEKPSKKRPRKRFHRKNDRRTTH